MRNAHTRNLINHIVTEHNIRVNGDLTPLHRAETLDIVSEITSVNILLEGFESIGKHLDRRRDVTINVGNSINVECEGVIVGREDDIEERSRELRVGLTWIERL